MKVRELIKHLESVLNSGVYGSDPWVVMVGYDGDEADIASVECNGCDSVILVPEE